MGLYDLFSDGKTQARPGSSGIRLIIGLIELLEDARDLIRRNSCSGVTHAHTYCGADGIDGQLDGPTVRRELERIRQQVAEHLVDSVEIPKDFVGKSVATVNAKRDLAL